MPSIQLVPAERIIISDNRQRSEFDEPALQALIESLASPPGLMSASWCAATAIPHFLLPESVGCAACSASGSPGGTAYFGGQPLPPYMVPTINLGDLDELAAEEAELEENVRREDLTWQEEADALNRLHALREKQARANGQAHSVADTTLEVSGRKDGAYQAAVRDKLLVAQHLADPEISKAKSVKEAVKVLAIRERKQQFANLSASVGASFTGEAHQLLLGDCTVLIKDMPANTFDVLCMDPPYGINAHTVMTDQNGHAPTSHDYETLMKSFSELSSLPNGSVFASLKAHLYLFCDIDRFAELRELCTLAGWWVHRTPITYCKPDAQRVPWAEHGPRRSTEWVLYAVKGKRRINHIAPDYFLAKQDSNTGHGAGKPVACYRELLSRSVRPGDHVGDFFMGSGSSLVAAHELKCQYTGIEIQAHWHGVAVSRLQELVGA